MATKTLLEMLEIPIKERKSFEIDLTIPNASTEENGYKVDLKVKPKNLTKCFC